MCKVLDQRIAPRNDQIEGSRKEWEGEEDADEKKMLQELNRGDVMGNENDTKGREGSSEEDVKS
jgi:hypothetical protein